MDFKMGDDLLSDLPQSIIEIILMKMPIRDAIKTCVLSSKWRFKWTTITSLKFDEYLQVIKMREEEIVKFITNTLFLHKGPIHRFELMLFALRPCSAVYQWILYLMKNGVMELIINIPSEFWRAPSCLFDCQKLTHLELHRCILRPPSNFQGFSSLKSLSLHDIDGPPEAIEFIISSSHLIETLRVSHWDIVKLHIIAPRLKWLAFEGGLEGIILIDTPLLVSVNVSMFFVTDVPGPLEQNHQSIFEKFLDATPLLERLVSNSYFVKYLSLGHQFARYSITCHHLAVIELHGIRFEDMEVGVVVRLLDSSPILHTLTISVSADLSESESPLEVKWDWESLPEGNLEHLCHVNLYNMLGKPYELLFVEFLLKRSSVLESLKISTKLLAAKRDKMLTELLGLCRASARAKIIIL